MLLNNKCNYNYRTLYKIFKLKMIIFNYYVITIVDFINCPLL